jgi:CRP-like cAMP-binding protein
MPVALAVLTQCPMFAGLPAELTRFCAEQARLVSFRRRESLANGDSGTFDGLGVVLAGSIQAVDLTGDGREVALVTALPYEAFGLAELLAARAQPLNWLSVSSSTVVALMERHAALEALRHPELALRAAASLAQRVCDAQHLHKVLTVHPVSARVSAWLLMQHDTQTGQVEVPTHAELAWLLNTTRESVTRVMQRLLNDGLIEREEAGWRVTSASALNEWARGRD